MKKKIVGILICTLFIGSILVCINGIAVEQDMKMIVPSNISKTTCDDILFSDDFNDNSKDYNKWTEIYSNGIWEETNGRAEFQLIESGGTGAHSEGIQSKAIQAMVGGDEPWENRVKVSWKMYPKIDATASEGKVAMKITEGRNYIVVEYDRTGGVARCYDNLGNNEVCIGGDEPWDNKLEIIGNKYFITMNMQSFTVDSPIFSSGQVTLRIELFVELAGSTRTKYLRSGFDDIIISQLGDNQPPDKPTCTYNKIRDKLVVTATDPDEDQVSYGVSWNNTGNVDEWTALFNSGSTISIDCNGRKGTVGVIAEDVYGAQSSWVSIKSKEKSIEHLMFYLFFGKIFQRFPFFEKILKQYYYN